MLEFIIIALFVVLLGYVIYNISDIIIILKNEDEENEENEEKKEITSEETLEKLLELYRELMTAKDELLSIAYFDDDYYDKRKKEKDLEKQIKELEK